MEHIKVIVQEADEDIRNILQIVLEDLQYNVVTVSGCEKILELIQSFKPQVVLLDYKFTGRECIEAVKKIKHFYPQLPVIVLSCNSNIHKVYHLNGFDDYICKPFDLDDFHSILLKHVKTHRKISFDGQNIKSRGHQAAY